PLGARPPASDAVIHDSGRAGDPPSPVIPPGGCAGEPIEPVPPGPALPTLHPDLAVVIVRPGDLPEILSDGDRRADGQAGHEHRIARLAVRLIEPAEGTG